jgi:hypothetical protein
VEKLGTGYPERIDEMAEELTGDPEFFHEKPHAPRG